MNKRRSRYTVNKRSSGNKVIKRNSLHSASKRSLGLASNNNPGVYKHYSEYSMYKIGREPEVPYSDTY